MRVGDLAEQRAEPQCWGIVLRMEFHQYEIYWMDGDRTWISQRFMVKKCP